PTCELGELQCDMVACASGKAPEIQITQRNGPILIHAIGERTAFITRRYGERSWNVGQLKLITSRAIGAQGADQHSESAAGLRLDIQPRGGSSRIRSHTCAIRPKEFEQGCESGAARKLGDLERDPVTFVHCEGP